VGRILVAIASVDGQAARIGERIGDLLARSEHLVTVRPANAQASPKSSPGDAVLVGASIRYGHHPRALEDWVRAQVAEITRRPTRSSPCR
jgi:menaquinone-dependent protoporphyrinogen oxidase